MEKIEIKIHKPSDLDKPVRTELGKHIVFVTTAQDTTAENPCEDIDGMGMVYSFCRRHGNFLKDFEFPEKSELETALRAHFNDDIVMLGYFEHGQCDWHVRGNKPPGTEVDYRFDGVETAGVWVPDAEVRKTADGKKLRGADRTDWMVEQAAACCKVYSQWCNGEVYGYGIAVYEAKHAEPGDLYDDERDYRYDEAVWEDSCYGFYGWKDLEQALDEAIKNCTEALEKL